MLSRIAPQSPLKSKAQCQTWQKPLDNAPDSVYHTIDIEQSLGEGRPVAILKTHDASGNDLDHAHHHIIDALDDFTCGLERAFQDRGNNVPESFPGSHQHLGVSLKLKPGLLMASEIFCIVPCFSRIALPDGGNLIPEFLVVLP